MNNERNKLIIEKWKETGSIKEAAQMFHLSPISVRQVLNSYGISTRKKIKLSPECAEKYKSDGFLTVKERNKLIIEEWKINGNVPAIAKLFNLHVVTVYNILHSCGIIFKKRMKLNSKCVNGQKITVKERNERIVEEWKKVGNVKAVAELFNLHVMSVYQILNSSGVIFTRKRNLNNNWPEEKIINTLVQLAMVLKRFPDFTDCSNDLVSAIKQHGGMTYFRNKMETKNDQESTLS